MNLQELLYELRQNILHDRSDAIPGAANDQLWSDDTLVRYINEAQKEVAARVLLLRDAVTPECCQVQTVVGQGTYPLHPKVLAVISAQVQGQTADLARAGHAALNNYYQPNDYFFDPSYLSSLPPGSPLAYTTDEGMMQDDEGSYNVMTLRVFPVIGPGYASLINLRVARLPLTWLSTANMNGRPEVPERWHMKMLDWAGYLALRQPDLDIAGGDGILRARDLKANFEDTVQEALKESKRRMFSPAIWSFGRNGFSYGRFP